MRILLVEDDPACQTATLFLLRHLGHAVDAADKAEEGLARFDPELHDLVVTDNRMPGMSGVELAAQLKGRSPATPVVIYSGCPEAEHGLADAFLTKPGSIADLQMMLSDHGFNGSSKAQSASKESRYTSSSWVSSGEPWRSLQDRFLHPQNRSGTIPSARHAECATPIRVQPADWQVAPSSRPGR